jgi:uncharacterized protein (DUF433 family)
LRNFSNDAIHCFFDRIAANFIDFHRFANGVGDFGRLLPGLFAPLRLYDIIRFMRNHEVISSSSGIMGGTPVFSETRVPIQTFIDYLEGGHSIDDFLEGFPTVKRKQVIAFLETVKKQYIKKAA